MGVGVGVRLTFLVGCVGGLLESKANTLYNCGTLCIAKLSPASPLVIDSLNHHQSEMMNLEKDTYSVLDQIKLDVRYRRGNSGSACQPS